MEELCTIRHCLLDCDHITYVPRVTSAEFRSLFINYHSLKWDEDVVMNQKHFIVATISIDNEVNNQTPRSCDSRNLNLSPFCDLTSTSSAMWLPSVLETYNNQTTSYVHQRTGPMRLKYPMSMEERELITSLTKVIVA